MTIVVLVSGIYTCNRQKINKSVEHTDARIQH